MYGTYKVLTVQSVQCLNRPKYTKFGLYGMYKTMIALMNLSY
jgi:hypothetical protein